MNYMKLIMSMILVSLLVGCTTTETSVENDVEDIEETSREDGVSGDIGKVGEVEEKVEVQVKVEGMDNAAKAKEIISVSDKARFYPTTKKLDIGDKYQYILAITNPSNEPFVGKTSINFKDALSKGIANKLDAEKITMNTWLDKTDFGDVVVKPNSILYLPVIVTVKDKIAKSLDTKPGSYDFQVIVIDNSTVYKTQASDWDVYHKDEFTIVVS